MSTDRGAADPVVTAATAVRGAVTTRAPRVRLAPLLLATGASQALLVVLGPTLSSVAREFGTSAGTAGEARSISALAAIVASLVITARIDSFGVPRMLRLGAVLAVISSAAVAAAPSLPAFLVAHSLVGVAFACLASAGFAGVAAFPPQRRPWALGFIAGANGLAWVLVNPAVGLVTGSLGWRAAESIPALAALVALVFAGNTAGVPTGPVAPRLHILLFTTPVRRWVVAEATAFAAWTAFLTFNGAFFIERFQIPEGAVGWPLGAAAVAYFVASTQSGRLVERVPPRYLVAGSSLLMAMLLPLLLGVARSVPVAVLLCIVLGAAAGIRTPASGGLGLAQLSRQAGAIMAVRTASTQLGYLLGALIGGAVIVAMGYGPLGLVLAAGLVLSALLVLRIDLRRAGVPAVRRCASPRSGRERFSSSTH